MPADPLPNFVSSLSKYFRAEDHYKILAHLHHDTPEADVRRMFGDTLFQTAQGRYLTVKNGLVVRDRLIDLVHEEGRITERVRMVMYFLFMFRDKRYRTFLCEVVGHNHGKWDTTVFREHRTAYFDYAGGHKAFTNLRQFLFQIGVLREADLTVHMPDLQGWFPDAVQVAAQSLKDDSARKSFIGNPYGFMIRYRINALLNATPDELAGLEIGVPCDDTEDPLAPADLGVGPDEIDTSDFKDWNRVPPSQRGGQDKYEVRNDPAALERASYQHYLLEKIMVGLCKHRNMTTQTNRHIDLVATLGTTSILFEMKSCTDTGIKSQVRRAVGQLLEYRYLYQKKLCKDVRLCVVVERRPRKSAQWLMGYLTHLGIGLIWKNDRDEGLNCTDFTKALLENFLPEARDHDFGLGRK
jgi:hypothetical protein